MTDTARCYTIFVKINSRLFCRQDDHSASDWNAAIEVDDILVEEANTPRRDHRADRPWLNSAVKPVKSVLSVPVQIKGTWTQGIIRSALQTACMFRVAFRIPADHILRWPPTRPLRLSPDRGASLKVERLLLADPNAIADHLASIHDEIGKSFAWIDNHGAGSFRRGVGNLAAPEFRVNLREIDVLNREWLIIQGGIHLRIEGIDSWRRWLHHGGLRT